MSEPNLTVEVDLSENGGQLSFANPAELRQWKELQWNTWQWFGGGSNGLLERKFEEFRQGMQSLQNESQEWERWLANNHEGNVKTAINRITALITQHFGGGRLLVAGTAKAKVVEEVRTQFGEHAAAGTYAALTEAPLRGQEWPPRFIEGLIHGANYRRGVDWTASAHRAELEELFAEYSKKLAATASDFELLKQAIELQRQKTGESEERQAADYRTVSEERAVSFQSAQDERTQKWDELLKQHIEKITTIESVYDQKLALQKPVKYWETKSTEHNRAAKIYGSVCAVVAGGCVYGLIELVRWAFGGLKPTDAPQHWHLAVLGIASFFAVWVVRILLRLLLSHLHLKTDAEERRIMILTFLSMSREGAEFAPEDKSLIVQHLFRSASDGLVKDDTAPPGILEFFTRSK